MSPSSEAPSSGAFQPGSGRASRVLSGIFSEHIYARPIKILVITPPDRRIQFMTIECLDFVEKPIRHRTCVW
jgi:hypothetical protein